VVSLKNDFANVILNALHRISDSVRKFRENKILVTILQLTFIAISILYLTSSLFQNQEELQQLQLNFVWLILALVATLGAVFMGSISWYVILQILGQKLNLVDAIYIHLYTNILKYLPGIGWQQGGKFILSRPYVEKKRTILWGMSIEYILLFSGGIAFALFALPWAIDNIKNKFIQDLVPEDEWLWLTILAGISLAVSVYVIHKITKKIFYTHAKWTFSLFSILLVIFGWLLLSLALYLVGLSLAPMNGIAFPIYALATPVAFLLGLSVIFVPGGLGIRESVMAYILQYALSPGLAVLIALLSRFCIALMELLAFVIIALIRKVILKSQKE